MKHERFTAEPRGPALQAYLLGLVEYDACLALQHRLVYELSGRDDGQGALLICEHPLTLTIGRRGSIGHVGLDTDELNRRGVPVRYVSRGDGVMLHAPGQLAVYPIVPLRWHGMSVGEYLDRLQSGILNTLRELHLQLETRSNKAGIWGRTGQLVSIGVSVRNWTTYHGACVNVEPPRYWYQHLRTDAEGGTCMSSLLAERHDSVKMTEVRSHLIRHLHAALGFDRHHVFTSHPLLPSLVSTRRGTAASAG